MAFDPTGTKWSVAGFNNDGTLGAFHPTPWEFNKESMNATGHWIGGYRRMPDEMRSFSCEILTTTGADPADRFEVHFVSDTRFVATKAGNLYRFGKKL